ncbi:hypothetical protein GCM10025870_08280 [Agromyces marinus]|uniref:ABC transporter domain-containing protein n=2 Tax=Agromyces marinus TaxID=1389020 RepID=A0ABM8GZ26_9MICO|nr:ABC transporter ATP-binding protein [Agromyces marinus]BDZ53755.1 hypothetical protein GCM10025870_08280 [Agromyces marinus]
MAPSLVRFQSVITTVTNNTPHARRVIDEITAAEAAGRERLARPKTDLPEHPRTLKFEQVTFRYADPAEPAVRSVDLEIPFGQTVAFVGSSGAGKSTIIDLLLGLIDPTEGTITVDGIPLTSLTTAWRSHVAYVPQEVSLFDSTVAQNVALTWREDFDRERVRDALDQAQLLQTIDARPDGIDGTVGERGLSLSGGQRQRIGIARALYADPAVLVMDEATSALDTATEAAITQRLKKMRGSMTIVMVAHRLATVMHADQIFYLRGGEVIGRGTFDELVRDVPDFAHQAALAGLVEPGSPSTRSSRSGDAPADD